MNWPKELKDMYDKHYVNLDHKDALEIAEQLEEKEQRINQLEYLVKKLMTGVWFVFLCLSIGIISKHFVGWNWVELLIDATIMIFFILLHIIRKKMKKKEEEKTKCQNAKNAETKSEETTITEEKVDQDTQKRAHAKKKEVKNNGVSQ